MEKIEDSARIGYTCDCDTGILRALLALADWAECTLTNFHRELSAELNPLHAPTNEVHLRELGRFERDCWLGTAAIRNSTCRNPLIVTCFEQLEKLHERSSSTFQEPWSKSLQSESFVPNLVALVSILLEIASRCKRDIQKTLRGMRA